MRQRLVMGNWKLNGTKETVVSLIKTFAAEANKYPKVEAAICAPAIFIGLVEENAKGSRLAWGSEDVDVNNQGAFTGENSPVQIKEFGCKYAIVGHSERRGYHKESSEYVAKKFKAAQAAGLKPVLCIGESLEEFEAGKTNEVVDAEIKAVIEENGIDASTSHPSARKWPRAFRSSTADPATTRTPPSSSSSRTSTAALSEERLSRLTSSPRSSRLPQRLPSNQD